MGQEETKKKLSSATLYCIHCWSLASLIKDKAGRNNYLMTPVSFLLMWQQSEIVGNFFFFPFTGSFFCSIMSSPNSWYMWCGSVERMNFIPLIQRRYVVREVCPSAKGIL